MTTQIPNPTKVSEETVYESLANDFDDYLNEKLKSDLQFQYEDIKGVTVMFIHNLIPDEQIFTIVTSPDDILVSRNYKGGAYNIPLVHGHLVDFLNALTSQ